MQQMDALDGRRGRFLNPDVVRPSLFLATIVITAVELLKESIVDRVRSFYINGLGENGLLIGSHDRLSYVKLPPQHGDDTSITVILTKVKIKFQARCHPGAPAGWPPRATQQSFLMR